MDRIQRGYYGYEFVREVVAARADAIRRVLPRGSRLIDLGCNDATISNVLIASGYASSSLGVDFEDTRRSVLPEMTFVEADLRRLDLASLPTVDVVLCLNVVHHLCLHGVDFTRDFLRVLATKAGAVLCDMGSLTAEVKAAPPWQETMRATWRSDEECWADLFRPFSWRRPLLTYPFQHGQRTLLKLTTALEPSYEYDVVEERGSARTLRRAGTEEQFWSCAPRTAQSAYGDRASLLLRSFLKDSPFDCVLPREVHATYGEVYAYDREIAAGAAVSLAASRQTLPGEDHARFLAFASQKVPALDDRPLHEVCEIKAVKTSRGLTFLGFVPREPPRDVPGS